MLLSDRWLGLTHKREQPAWGVLHQDQAVYHCPRSQSYTSASIYNPQMIGCQNPAGTLSFAKDVKAGSRCSICMTQRGYSSRYSL